MEALLKEENVYKTILRALTQFEGVAIDDYSDKEVKLRGIGVCNGHIIAIMDTLGAKLVKYVVAKQE